MIGCDEDSGINFAALLTPAPLNAVIEITGLTPGKMYFIRMQGNADAVGDFCIGVFDTYTPGSSACEAIIIHPNDAPCDVNTGNAVVNSTSSNSSVVNGIQPNAYVPIGIDYCGNDDESGQYGSWVTFEANSTSVTLTNQSGGARDYNLFSGSSCFSISCIEGQQAGAGGTVDFNGLLIGTMYYILTTLQSGATTDAVNADLCLSNNFECIPPANDDCANAIEVFLDVPVKATTYCAINDNSGCSSYKNVWYHWVVPAVIPGEGQTFFQVWNKNCTGGPGNLGINLKVALSDPCGFPTCLDSNDPGSGDWNQTAGFNPKDFSTHYWMQLDGHMDISCDFNFMVSSVPGLKGVDVNNDTICAGESATLTASGGTGYEWGGGEISTSITVSPTVTTTYTVTATAGADGYAIATVTVAPAPTVTVNDAALCGGGASSAVLTASGADTYSWSPATDLDATTGATVNATPSSTTVYTVTGTTLGCTGTATSTVTAGGSIPVSVNDGAVCDGASTILTTSGATTYTWAPATGLSATTGDNVIASPATTTSYTVTGDTDGCTGTAESVVTVSAAPTITSDNSTICTGLTATLTASGGTSYIWDDGTSTTTGVSFITPALIANTSYTVTGTDATGCSNTAVGSVTIASGLTILVNDGAVCPGAGATLNASGATNYDWLPVTDLSSSTGASVTATPSVTTTYTVTGETNGCVGEAESTVTITPLDDAAFAYSGATFCAPSDDTPTATLPGGIYTIAPSGDLAIVPGTGFIDVIAGSTVQHYDITYTTGGACANTSTTGIDVVANPDATFNYAASPYCQVGTATITQPAGSTPGDFTASPATLVFISTTTGEVDLVNSPAGSFTITNTIPAGNGCPAAMETATIDVTATPVVSSTSVNVCDGDAGTINASDIGGSTTITYSWAGGGIPALADLTDTPTVTTTYTVTGNDNGCNSVPAEGTITVDPLPTITVSSTSTCAGTSATITASGGTSYTWVGGGAPSGADLSDGPVSTTSYTVTGTDATTCSNTAVGTITVSSGITLTISPSDVTICTGQTGATLTANGASAYSWNTGEATPGIQVNPTTTTTYTVTESGAGGCAAIATATVTVNTTPTVSVTSGAACDDGSSVTITASGDADGYAWSDGSSGASLTATSPVGVNTYTVTATSGGNCPVTETGDITITSIPTVTVNNASICEGQSATLIASGASAYTWSPNIGSSSSVTTAPIVSTSYTVTGTTSTCFSTAVSNVTVEVSPTVIVSSDSVCAGEPATLTASGATSYSWLPGGSAGSAITVSPTQTTTYTVTGLTAANCPGTGTGIVTAYPAPVAAFVDPGTVNLSESDISFIDKSTNANDWVWNFGDGGASTSQNPQHLFADTGRYTILLKVESSGSCVDSVMRDIYIVPDIIVYIPNAFTPDGNDLNEGFSMKSSGVQADGFEFRVFDRWGEQVFFTKDINEEWMGDNNGGADCPQDVYVYVVIVKDGGTRTKKYMGHVTLVR